MQAILTILNKIADPICLDIVTSVTTILWWYCRRCSPLPIPNREVKPAMADGTAPQCGRVGSCHILLKVQTNVWTFFMPYPKRSPLPFPNREVKPPGCFQDRWYCTIPIAIGRRV